MIQVFNTLELYFHYKKKLYGRKKLILGHVAHLGNDLKLKYKMLYRKEKLSH